MAVVSMSVMPSVVVVKRLSGITYISAAGATGLETVGVVGGLIGTLVGLFSLALYVASDRRQKRREAAELERQHQQEVQAAFDRGWRMRGQVMGDDHDGPAA